MTRILTPSNVVAIAALSLAVWQAGRAADDASAAEQSQKSARRTLTAVTKVKNETIELADLTIKMNDGLVDAVRKVPGVRTEFMHFNRVKRNDLIQRIRGMKK